MNIYAVPPLISSILFITLGLFVFLNNPKSRANQTFGLTCLATFWWQFSWFILFSFGTEELARIMVRVGYTGIIFIPITFYHYFTIFLKRDEEKPFVYAAYLVGSALLYFNWTSDLFLKGYYKYFWGYYPKASFLHPIYLLALVLMACRVFYLLYKELSKSKPIPFRHNQVKYLFCAIGIYTIASLDFAVNYGLEIYPPGFIFIMASLGTVAYTIVRFRLMDIRVAITRAGIFTGVYALVLVMPFWIGYITKSWLISTSLAVVLATIGPIINRYLRQRAENRLLAEDLKKYDILKRLTRTIGLIRDLDEIVLLIVYRLVKTLRVSHAMIFLFDRAENSYVLKSMRRLNGIKLGFSSNIPSDTDFIKFLLLWRKDLLLEDIQKLIQEPKPNNSKHDKGYDQINLPKVASLMQAINASLIIPHFLEKELIGFLVLGKKDSNRPYSEADIEVLSTLSRSASLQIMNAMSMIELRNREREFADAARIIEIGNYASGTEHQLGNVLNTIIWACHGLKSDKTIANVLQHDPEASLAFGKRVDAIITDAKDGGTIVKEIRDYSQQGADKQHTLTSLKEVLDKTLRILYIHVNKFQNIDISIDISSDVPLVLASPVGLQQVFINMFNNAYDSIQEMKEHITSHPELGITDYKGRIEVRIRRVKGKVEIHVIDNGKGIQEDVSRKLFAPHFTTKGSSEKRKEMNLNGGTGIGLYIMRRIIFDHGGTIALFRSEPLKGADFIIQLPVPKQ